MHTRFICCASSRVGETTITVGYLGEARFLVLARMCEKAGIKKESVFPDPVSAIAMQSFLLSRIGLGGKLK